MNILILGNGGREYSIGLAISKEKESHNITFCPGNGATDLLGQNINISKYEDLALWAKKNSIDLTIVGPEAPLVDGVVDIFKQYNLAIFGPSILASKLEGSKVYMKNILKKYNIPTALFIQTVSQEKADKFIDNMNNTPIVVKADGLCGGKGVIIAQTKDEAKEAVANMLSGDSFGDAGKEIIIEEYLDGYELSVFAICDGDNYIVLPAAQDHKRVGNNDTGPNTGGMGAYAPTPLINDDIYAKINNNIIEPTLNGMKKENAPFSGVLFIGIMMVNNEPIVLEYNVRFGDPECEVLMPLIKSSVSEMFYKGATSQLNNYKLIINNLCSVAVVMASENYPYSSSKSTQIIIDETYDQELLNHSHISYASVSKEDDTLFTNGGRILLCVGFGQDIQTARNRAYALCGQVHFTGKKCRTDIAYQALGGKK